MSKRESQDRHSGLVGYHSGLGEDHRGLEDERGNETSDIEGESDLEEEEKAERNVEEELILNSKRSIQNPKENKGRTKGHFNVLCLHLGHCYERKLQPVSYKRYF